MVYWVEEQLGWTCQTKSWTIPLVHFQVLAFPSIVESQLLNFTSPQGYSGWSGYSLCLSAVVPDNRFCETFGTLLEMKIAHKSSVIFTIKCQLRRRKNYFFSSKEKKDGIILIIYTYTNI